MDSWMFFDVSKADEQSKVGVVQMFAQIIRAIVYTNDVICPPATQDIDFTKTVAFGFDKSMPYRNKYMEGVNTIGELYVAAGGDELFNEIGITKITKEEFYSLN